MKLFENITGCYDNSNRNKRRCRQTLLGGVIYRLLNRDSPVKWYSAKPPLPPPAGDE